MGENQPRSKGSWLTLKHGKLLKITYIVTYYTSAKYSITHLTVIVSSVIKSKNMLTIKYVLNHSGLKSNDDDVI